MKFHSGTHSGTAVSGLETVNFSVIMKRGKENQVAENMAEIEDMEAVEDLTKVKDLKIIDQNQ